MATSISELRLQLFQDAPDFGDGFDLDGVRYSSIRENYLFYGNYIPVYTRYNI